MFEKQITLAGEARVEGVGLHTGTKSEILFKPAPINTGVVFRRVDLEDSPEIPALRFNRKCILKNSRFRE